MASCMLGVLAGSVGYAQERGTPAEVLLQPYGGAARFPQLYRRALTVLINAEDRYFQGQYAQANALLEQLWADVPPGSAAWTEVESEGHDAIQASGLNIGSPPCYYALRMLKECCEWKLNGSPAPEPTTVTWRVLLVEHLQGKRPRNKSERANGRGPTITCDLDPRISQRDHQVVRQSTRLFREYIIAITQGRLNVQLEFLPLDELTVQGIVNAEPNSVAGITDEGFAQIWQSVPMDTRRNTDWWWILYPSNLPEMHEDFRKTEFVTGGMGVGPDGRSPCFIIDDRWLVRKPPHLGHGDMHPLERRAYLPQWLQHEFFHHLYRTYPEFGLESDKGHDWFNRSTWPADFVGEFEPDYYYESLHKRLQQATKPLHVALKYTVSDLTGIVTPNMLAGHYRREPAENGWHQGELTNIGTPRRPKFRWTNEAEVAWSLTPNYAQSALDCEEGSPYFDAEAGKQFVIELKPPRGQRPREVAGFHYNGDFYKRISGR
jgi:hypothetical protein